MVVSNLLWMWIYRAVVHFHATKLKVAKEKKDRAIAGLGCHSCRGKRRKSQVPHLRRSQAPPRPQRRPGSADILILLIQYIYSIRIVKYIHHI